MGQHYRISACYGRPDGHWEDSLWEYSFLERPLLLSGAISWATAVELTMRRVGSWDWGAGPEEEERAWR